MILVHDNGNVRIGFYCCQNQVAKEVFSSIITSATRSLQNYGAICLDSSLQDCLNLLQIVNVESWDAVTVFSCVIQQ